MRKLFKSRQELILWLSVGLYSVIFITISCLRHAHFLTQAWDLGIFTQIFWNTIHGNIMQGTIEEIPNHLGVHWSPFLFLLVPGFRVFSSPYYLLIIQTVALALGALPLFYLARLVLRDAKHAMYLSLCYLLYPSLHWVNLYDFHEVAFLPVLLISAIYFFLKKSFFWSAVFFLLAASISESSIAVIISVSVFCFLYRRDDDRRGREFWLSRNRLFGALLFVFSLVYFILAIKVFMPAFGGGLLRIDRYEQFGNGTAEVFKNFFLRPDILFSTIWQAKKFMYLLSIFLPVLFLPWLSWRSYFLFLPGILQNILTNSYTQNSSHYQYDALIIPGLWIGVVFGYSALKKKVQNLSQPVTTIFGLGVIGCFLWLSPLGINNFPSQIFRSDPIAEIKDAIVSRVPPWARVAAFTDFVPHLAMRQNIAMIGQEKFSADIVIVDMKNMFPFEKQEDFQRYLDIYGNSQEYNFVSYNKAYGVFYRPSLKSYLFEGLQ